MTPFNPQQIAEEAAEKLIGAIVAALESSVKNWAPADRTRLPELKAVIKSLILQAAARMVRESGAVEALQDAQDTLHALSKIHPASVGEAWDEAGIDAALSALRDITKEP